MIGCGTNTSNEVCFYSTETFHSELEILSVFSEREYIEQGRFISMTQFKKTTWEVILISRETSDSIQTESTRVHNLNVQYSWLCILTDKHKVIDEPLSELLIEAAEQNPSQAMEMIKLQRPQIYAHHSAT